MGRGQRFETLDGMRGLCALIVVLYHSGQAIGGGVIIPQGWICVDMFFVLSGFVIALTYEERLRAGGYFRTFLSARGRRLIPTQTIGTLICIPALVPLYAHNGLGWGDIAMIAVTGLLLIPILWTPLKATGFKLGIFPANFVLWSLWAEWAVNLIYARALYRASMVGLVAFCVAATFSEVLMVLIPPNWIYPLRSVFHAGVGFSLGVILFRIRPWLSKLPAVHPFWVYVVWAAICCLPVYPDPNPLLTLGVALICSAMVALMIRGERSIGSAINYLGKLSYPLYASHVAVVNLGALVLGNRGYHSKIWVIPVTLVAILLAAAIERLVSALDSNLQSNGSKPRLSWPLRKLPAD